MFNLNASSKKYIYLLILSIYYFGYFGYFGCPVCCCLFLFWFFVSVCLFSGVGVGVDYGIYIYSRLREFMATESSLYEAYWKTLCQTGSGVLFTAIGLTSWIFSPLKFQADMGILLTFMFLVNMLGAIFLLPALVCWYKKMAQKTA